MSEQTHASVEHDLAPGEEEQHSVGERILGYVVGLGLALLLTATSFFIAGTNLVWQPSIPVALIVLAIAQMGVHLVFFLHITTGADNTNNAATPVSVQFRINTVSGYHSRLREPLVHFGRRQL
jgi:cytochrome o ubiquinol oxidase operon protein cyoD